MQLPPQSLVLPCGVCAVNTCVVDLRYIRHFEYNVVHVVDSGVGCDLCRAGCSLLLFSLLAVEDGAIRAVRPRLRLSGRQPCVPAAAQGAGHPRGGGQTGGARTRHVFINIQ